jgi:hydrophobe/amphiphile efflux-1 (HAE1) family protein
MFSAIFVRRPKFALVISLFLIISGLVCVFQLPVAEHPEISPPTVVVMAAYPGATAQEIADTVAAPIEAEINGIEDLIYYSSTSDNSGNYNLTLTFKSDADANMAYVNVNNAIKRAEHSLPSVVTNTGLFVYKRSSDILGVYAITGDKPENTPLEMSNYAAIHIRDAISRIDGVGYAVVFTDMTYSMRIKMDPIKMRALGVSTSDIRTAVAGQNIQAAAGSVGSELSNDVIQFKIVAPGRLKDAPQFEKIVVKTGKDNRQVLLGDVATVELGSEHNTVPAYFDGRPTIPLAIFKNNDANALQVINKVNDELKELSKKFPDGMRYEIGYDSTNFVRVTMKEIVSTLLLTFILVVAITWAFLQDWRATIIPSVTIPVSLIGTFIFMRVLGMSINTLTMFALILVIGSVVDDAICVTESCVRMIQEEGLSPRDAALKTMKQITGALIATTLVVIAVYAPIGFYSGMVGKIYAQFAITMCIALCLSTLNAMTLSPALCALVLRKQKPPRGLYKIFNAAIDGTRNGYLAFAKLLVRRGVLTLVIFGAILSGNYFLYKKLPGSFLPQEDKGALLCEVTLPPGATLKRTEESLLKIQDIARKTPGVKHVLLVPGRSLSSGQGENLGLAIIELEDWDKRKTPELQIGAVQKRLQMQFLGLDDAEVQVFVPPPIMGLGATGGVSFALQATGNQSAQELDRAKERVLGEIMGSKKALYAFSSYDANTPMLYLNVDSQKAMAMGVQVQDIYAVLQRQFGSDYINDINKFGKTYKVKSQAAEIFRSDPNKLDQLYVKSSRGKQVPLSTLVEQKWTLGPRQVERFNMFPSANIKAQSLPGVSSGELMETIQKIVDKLGKGYQLSWTEMSFEERQNQGQILYLLILALTFSYLFLVAQYESWTMPLSVILSVGVATLGGMLAMLCFKMPLNIYCQLGLLMLIGLTAKSAILMAEYSKQERDEGKDITEAALDGMRLRFRSVMMTALSFVIGVFPMVVAAGAGAGSRRSIGITTFFGMLLASIIGVMFIPCLYAAFQRMAEWTADHAKRLFGDHRHAE